MMHTPAEQFPLENLMGNLTTDEEAFFAQSVDGSTPSVSSDTDSASHDDCDESKMRPHTDTVQGTELENPIVIVATDQQEGNMLSTSAYDAHCVAESKDAVTDATGKADHPVAALSSQSIEATGEAGMDAHAEMGFEDTATDDVRSIVILEAEVAVFHPKADVMELDSVPDVAPVSDIVSMIEDPAEDVPVQNFNDAYPLVEENTSLAPVQDSDDATHLTKENQASDPVLDTAKILLSFVEEKSASDPVQDSDDAVPFVEENSVPDLKGETDVPSEFSTTHSVVAIEDPLTDILSFANETTVSAPKTGIALDYEPPFMVAAEDPAVSDVEDTLAVLVVENAPVELSPWDMTDQTLVENVDVADVREPETQSEMISHYPILDGITDSPAELDVKAATTTEVLQDAEDPAELTVLVRGVGECHLDETEQSSNPEVSIRDVHEFDATEIDPDVEATIRALLALSPIHKETKDAVLPSVEKIEEDVEVDATAVEFDPLLIEEESIEDPQVSTPTTHGEDGPALVVDDEMTSNAGQVYFDVEPEKPESERDVEHILAIDVDAVEKNEEDVEVDATAVEVDPLLIEVGSIEEPQVSTPAAHDEDGPAQVADGEITSNAGKINFHVAPVKPESERDVEHILAIDVDAFTMPVFTGPDTPHGEDEIHDRYAISHDVMGDEDVDDKYAARDAESVKGTNVVTITTVDYTRTKSKALVRFVDVEPERPSDLLSQDEVLSEPSPHYEDRVDADAMHFNKGGCVDCVIL
ncbi:hypothetical protein MHU86_13510 [Fragilaria crotonensis]|nr:hypothetical protein MHU86_13510 [Fragilaria crotonensis]